jgi:PAS domain S-box-containing protein
MAEEAKQRRQNERDGFLEQLTEENEDLRALTQFTASAISTLNLDELLRVLLERTVAVTRADTVTILLKEGAELRPRASAGAAASSDSTGMSHVVVGFAEMVGSRLKPVYVEDAAVDPLVTSPLMRERSIRSMLGIPLKLNDTLIGVLHVAWLTVQPRHDRQVHLLEAMAEGCAAAIRNSRLYQEARRIAASVSESEARLRRIIESDMIGLVFSDSSGCITEANDAFLRIVGYTQDDVRTGRIRWRDLVPPEFRVSDENAERELAATGTCTPFEKEYFRKDGSRVPVLVGGATLPHLPGQGVAFVLDISTRRQAEAGLRLQSAALNATANVIVITDRSGTIEWVNPAFSAVTGYRPEEAIGKNQGALVKSGVHDQAFYGDLWDTILAGRVWHGVVTNRRKDGSLYTVDQSITSVKGAGGGISHFIAVERDLTEQKRLEAQFLQAQKMQVVGQLASGIAHDFNNLLTVINGVAESALMSLGADAPLRADLLEIQAAGDRAASLTRQLLAFSRQQIMKPVVLNLSSLVADMRGMLQRLIGEAIDLEVLLANDGGNVLADPRQIEQVVMNLVVNARDAMTNGGTLAIETRSVELDETHAAEHPSVRPGPHVMLAISDTGAGMDEATRRRVFEPFFTTKGPGKGTGLGLSTVYGIVKQSGGSVWVYSELGQGTTFKIYLPRVDAVAQKVQLTPTATSVRGTETVLIVEDEAKVRHLAERILRAAGYTVLTARNGVEALLLVERHDGPVHLMLTDVVMPGMTGRSLATQLKDTRPRTKVLFMSGYTDDAILHHGLLDNATHFVSKPYAASELTRKVREALDS